MLCGARGIALQLNIIINKIMFTVLTSAYWGLSAFKNCLGAHTHRAFSAPSILLKPQHNRSKHIRSSFVYSGGPAAETWNVHSDVFAASAHNASSKKNLPHLPHPPALITEFLAALEKTTLSFSGSAQRL